MPGPRADDECRLGQSLVILGHAVRGSAAALPMPAAYFLLIQREYGTTPARRKALSEGTGVREGALTEPGAEITLGQLRRQIQNANRLLEPGWELPMASQLHASAHGAVGFAAVSAPTLRQSFEVIARFGHVRAPFHRVRVSAEKQEHRFVFEERAGLAAEEWRVLLNLVALSAQGFVESVLGRPMKEARFELPYPAPEYAARYGEHFHAPVRFGCREAAIVIPSAWLALECPLADPVMYEASLRSLETGDRRLEGRSFTVARVEQLIASRGERLGVEKAARLLHVSRRTLVRRLRHGGTSYRSLLEAHQKKRAEVLLRDPELSVAEVAYELGYEDPANFGRACRRWFGVSPGKWRGRTAH